MWFSLTDWDGLNNGNETFLWFENYKTIFADVSFAYSFFRTVLYSVLNIIMINLVAFLLALIVVQNLKGKNVYRAAFFMPNLIGGLVLGYIWQFIYNRAMPVVGDKLVNGFSIDGSGFLIDIFNNGLLSINDFLGSILVDGNNAMIGLIIVVSWQYAGYIMMIYIAALQNVPQDLIEASKIDGANAIQRLRTITLPMIAQAFTIAMFLTLTTSFKQYDTVVSLTGGGPSTKLPLWLANLYNVGYQPATDALDFLAINIYDEAFVNFNMGVGQAKAITFFVVLLVVSLVQVSINKRKEVEL
jgi:raffinose/stachyose/melibiose transport system permease protein